MPREVFTAGQILTAAELNVVSDQTVMTFAGTAARGSAIPSPTEGMISYLEDSNTWEGYTTAWGSLVKIAQIVTTTKTDTFSSSVASGASIAITGLSVTITPKSSSNNIFVIFNVQVAGTGNDLQTVGVTLKRDSTAIGIGASAGNRSRITASSHQTGGSYTMSPISGTFIDSPATVSATSYSLDIFNGDSATRTLYVNRSDLDADLAQAGRAVSSITAIEVIP